MVSLSCKAPEGCVVTYAYLVGTAPNHRQLIERYSMLVVPDEVHHLAEKRAWGRAALTMIGGDPPVATVLNTTGTLFRSTGKERIPTVDYEQVSPGLNCLLPPPPRRAHRAPANRSDAACRCWCLACTPRSATSGRR